jgi:hypothetical protein
MDQVLLYLINKNIYKDNSKNSSGESLKVIDANEGFEFEILPSDFNGTSAIWIA